jgi:hypothetical protein
MFAAETGAGWWSAAAASSAAIPPASARGHLRGPRRGQERTERSETDGKCFIAICGSEHSPLRKAASCPASEQSAADDGAFQDRRPTPWGLELGADRAASIFHRGERFRLGIGPPAPNWTLPIADYVTILQSHLTKTFGCEGDELRQEGLEFSRGHREGEWRTDRHPGSPRLGKREPQARVNSARRFEGRSGKQLHHRLSEAVLGDVEGAFFHVVGELGRDTHGAIDRGV